MNNKPVIGLSYYRKNYTDIGGYWVLLQAMFMNDKNKRQGQTIKIAREGTNNQEKKYNSVKHLQRQQFSFTKKVSLKILSL